MLSLTWPGLYLLALAIPAALLSPSMSPEPSGRRTVAPITPCECTATFTQSGATKLCPNGSVGIQVICQDPALEGGPCESPIPCHPFAGSKCKATFGADDLNFVLSNCYSGGLWLKVSGYNGGARFFYAGIPVGFDLPVIEVSCLAGTAGESSGTVEVTFHTADTDASLFHTWTSTLHCKKCDA